MIPADPRTAPTGTRLPTVILDISQERINRYADLSGDYNPLHVDPAFGRQSPFGSTIAHGPLSAACLFQVLAEWSGVPWPGGATFDFIYTAPVRAGDSITATGTVAELTPEQAPKWLTVDLSCTNQRGETVIVATARVPLSEQPSTSE
ncbi:MAG TPA: acyl dehydratase [Chloroflexi bacterium]|nr:acyl dehydratase [Chloroflexota bacterium]